MEHLKELMLPPTKDLIVNLGWKFVSRDLWSPRRVRLTHGVTGLIVNWDTRTYSYYLSRHPGHNASHYVWGSHQPDPADLFCVPPSINLGRHEELHDEILELLDGELERLYE